MSHTITVRIQGTLAEWLDQQSAKSGESKGKIIRDQLERARTDAAAKPFMRLAGTIRGSRNLSRRRGFSRT
jgi:hypothetical protein